MRKFSFLLLFGLIGWAAVLPNSPVEAADGEEFSITVTPAKNVEVKGDEKKFRAHHWMDEGYSGGIKDLFFSKEYEDDSMLTFEGHSLPDDNDHEANVKYSNPGIGTFQFVYESFRKYYDDSGGFFYPFSTLQSSDLNRDLELDIQSLFFSFAPEIGDQFTLLVWYEHHMKDGDKSRLNWAEAREGAVAREITPTYQSIDEKVDIFGVRGGTEIAGFDVSAEHTYERTDSDNTRYERWLSTAATPSQRKQRAQNQKPESDIFTTTFQGNRWFGEEDTSYLNLAYRYASLENEELENIVESDEFGVPTNFSFAHQIVNAQAYNEVDSHTVVGHYMYELSKTLRFTVKSRNQLMKRKGESIYPSDDSPATPDGIIDETDYSQSREKLWQFGQNFAVQYTGIEKASIYGDIELTEMNNDLNEIQRDSDYLFNWQRVTETKTKKAQYTLGTRIIPSRFYNITFQARRKYENNDYDDEVDTSGAINSAFVDSLQVIGDELTTKLTWKPLDWLQSSIRYQFNGKKYKTRVQGLSDTVETRFRSHTFTYDIFVQVMKELFVNGSYTYQDANTTTPAASSSNPAMLPGFSADLQSLLVSTSYVPTDEWSITAAVAKTFTDNFNDFTSSALPLAASNDYYTAEVTMSYAPRDKNWSVEPHYAYYHYDTTSVSEFGNYIAHVAWLDFNYHW
ncbi:MAG: hypothetical protein H6756_13940 [Candidatus Omnitrophica bacterium]|nr:hypothetical protein [Candidatus Omnitrophota bacterium]